MISLLKPKSEANVLFLGNPKSGSWKIRAQQIASTRHNWACGNTIDRKSLQKFDIFVSIKELNAEQNSAIIHAGKKHVFDVVDFWQQPEDSILVSTIDEARSFFRTSLKGFDFSAVIFPNAQMQTDLGDLVNQSTCIYHHYYPKLQKKKLSKINNIGYKGRKKFLDDWLEPLENTVRKKGLCFSLNPKHLEHLDIGVIARGGKYNGFMEQRYKSNVKLANLMACGIPPLILNDGCSYHETWNHQESYFSSVEEFDSKLDKLINDQVYRNTVAEKLYSMSTAFQLDTIARQYDSFFAKLLNSDSQKQLTVT